MIIYIHTHCFLIALLLFSTKKRKPKKTARIFMQNVAYLMLNVMPNLIRYDVISRYRSNSIRCVQ